MAIVLGLLIAITGVIVFWIGARWVSQFDAAFVARATTTLGAWLSIAALLIPVMVVRRPVLSVRAFLGYPIPVVAVGITSLAFAIIGPGILLAPAVFAPVSAWPDESSRQVAWVAAPLLFLQTLLTIRFARQLGMLLRRYPRTAAWIDFFSVVVLLLGAAIVLVVLTPRIPQLGDLLRLAAPFNGFFRRVPDVLANTPFGMLWAAPGYASTRVDDVDAAWRTLGLSALLVVVLLVAWFAFVGFQLRPTRRQPGPRRERVPGWFARFPATPAGAVAARSVTYWLRDPRYRAVYGVLPLVVIVVLLALWVGGVPFASAVLVPLPLMTFLLGWSTIHNDIAYDNTAVWQHVAAQTRGVDDRSGRAIPVLLGGIALLAIGIPLTVWGNGDPRIAAPLAGVCLALLLGGIGVGSLYSARFPYAAPRPGDPAWQAPQVATSQGGVAQGISVLLVILVAVPSLALAVMWWVAGGWWGWLSLLAGVLAGAAMLAIGIRRGGRSFESRGPELLAFTMRN